MNTWNLPSQSIVLEPFDRIVLRDPANQVELIVCPAERSGLTIQAPDSVRRRMRIEVQERTLRVDLTGTLLERIQDALTTSLTRKHVRLIVSAPSLCRIDVLGWVSVDTRACGDNQPQVVRKGPFGMLAHLPPRY
jgi:hypothetical protein